MVEKTELRIYKISYMTSPNGRDKCEKCGTMNKIYHFIYDEKLKKLNQAWISRKAGEGELVFCSKECHKGYVAPCHKCWGYRKGGNWQRSDKDDGKRFCSKECFDDYYAPTCDYCHKGKGYYNKKKENDGKYFCSQKCLNIFYAPTCDNCQKQCLKYSPSGKAVDSECYYNDAENKTGNICFDCNKKKDEYVCDKCNETKLGRYWLNKNKNDDKKFCSDNCFGIYYGYYVENCQECSQKLFRSYQSYCSACKWKHEAEIRKEEAEKRKKAKELKDSCNNDLGTVYCRYCSAKTDNIFDVCDKEICLTKMNKENEETKDKKEKDRNQKNISNDKYIVKNLLHYFQQNNIKYVKLEDNKLLIKYNYKTEEEQEDPKTEQLQQIKNYIQQQPAKILTYEELEQKSRKIDSSNSESNKDKNYKTALIIGGGIVGVILIGVGIIWAIWKKR